MQSKAKTVAAYLSELPEERRVAMQTVRETILKNLDVAGGFTEGMQYGMIGYAIPHSIYPAGYHCDPRQPLPFAMLTSQKNHMAIHLMCLYRNAAETAWFEKAWASAGKKLDAGKACVRFKKLDDVALDVLGEAIRRVTVKGYIEHYEAMLGKAAGSKKKPATGNEKPAESKVAKKGTATAAVKKPRSVSKKAGKPRAPGRPA